MKSYSDELRSVNWSMVADRLYWAANRILEQWKSAISRPRPRLTPGSSFTSEDNEWFNDIDIFPVYLLLMGFAFENLMKQVIILDRLLCGPWDPDPMTVKDFGIKTHDLINLMRNLPLNITEEEETALELATDFTVWKGRYPVPIKPQDFESYEDLPIDMSEWVMISDTLNQLYRRAGDYLEELINV